MERVNQILKNQVFSEQLKKLSRLEQGRIYCGHGIDHLLAVARIAYIKTLEEGLPFQKDIIYAAALLHDVGRAAQYETGIPHDQAGALLAETILSECGFDAAEDGGTYTLGAGEAALRISTTSGNVELAPLA